MRVAPLLAISILAAGICAGAVQARGYTRCAQCGTIVDVDPIVYDETDRTRGAAEGSIIAGVLGSHKDTGRQAGAIAGTTVDGLIGRLVKRSYTGPGTPGLRVEFKYDSGGRNIVELAGRPRLYRDDRILIKDGKLKLNY